MGRDDWKYYDDDWSDSEDEEREPPTERQCPNCLHFFPVDAPYCQWCGKVSPPARKPPAR